MLSNMNHIVIERTFAVPIRKALFIIIKKCLALLGTISKAHV